MVADLSACKKKLFLSRAASALYKYIVYVQHICICMYVHTYMHLHACVKHAYICIYVHTYVCTLIYMYTHVCMWVPNPYMYIHMYVTFALARSKMAFAPPSHPLLSICMACRDRAGTASAASNVLSCCCRRCNRCPEKKYEKKKTC